MGGVGMRGKGMGGVLLVQGWVGRI
jgi:hypothetical protein